MSGPHSILSGSQAWVELSCSFTHTMEEYGQLDLKWYYSTQEEPFLEWVPSTGREPQLRESMLSSSMSVRHQARNTTMGRRVRQVLRLAHPTTLLSGEYHCRVATFTHEERRSHTMTVFGRD